MIPLPEISQVAVLGFAGLIVAAAISDAQNTRSNISGSGYIIRQELAGILQRRETIEKGPGRLRLGHCRAS
jgi:hypothetical protein